jgi:hypothetical protein
VELQEECGDASEMHREKWERPKNRDTITTL